MQRPPRFIAIAGFAFFFFVTMTSTAWNSGDLVVRTFALICSLASLLAFDATWNDRSNAVKSVAILSITAVVFGVSIIFYARAYPVDSAVVTLANATVAASVFLAVIAWQMRKVHLSGRRSTAKVGG